MLYASKVDIAVPYTSAEWLESSRTTKRYSGRQSDVADIAETPTKSFVNLDAQIAVRPFDAYPGIEFALIGKNLTNTVQRNAVALNKDEVIMPGRDVRLVLRAAF